MSIGQIIILLFIGYIIFTIDTRKENFPVPTILILIGMIMALLPFFQSLDITEKMIYYIFLPALLFVSAYQYPIKEFRKNAGFITALATAGIILTVILLGSLVWLVSPISFVTSLLVAAILTPTDPISVVSIIKSATNDEEIADIVEGESMLNDGTSIVVFTSIFSVAAQEKSFQLLSFIGEFLYVSIGGIIIGLICGYATSKIIHVSHDRNYQIMLSIILAYGSFILAETLGISGVLATVTSGMMISFEYGRAMKEEHFRDSLNGFWTIVETSFLAVLFLLIGIEMTEYLAWSYWLYAWAIFIFMVMVRFIIVYGFSFLIHPMHWHYPTIITWGGLKGTMTVYLILHLHSGTAQHIPGDWIIGVTFTVVLISMTLQALTISPVSKKLLK